MSTPGKHVADLVLDRYLAGDLAPHARAELERQLGSSPELRARLDALRAQRDAFLAEEPPERFARRVAAKVATERRARPRLLVWLAPASAAAVGVLAVAFALRSGDDRPAAPAAWREERAPSLQAEPAAPGESAATSRAQAPAAGDRAPAPGQKSAGSASGNAGAPLAKKSAAPSTPPPALARRSTPSPVASSAPPATPVPRSPPPSVAAGASAPTPAPPSSAPAAAESTPAPPLAAASRPESLVAPPSRRSSAALREAPAEPPGPTIATRGALAAAHVTPVLRASLPRLVAARRAAGVATRPLTVTCDIDSRGNVTAARVLAPALSEQAARPILVVLRGLRFPAASPAGSTTLTLTLPAAR